MKLKLYQIDAFSDRSFSGNPAAVCPLHEWISEDLMQKIAMENNLAETAFYVQKENQVEIRWFTPTVEVDLCGHATLASAYVLFNYEGFDQTTIHFYSPRSGALPVKKNGRQITLNFPVDTLVSCEITEELHSCFEAVPQEAYKGKTDYVLVFDSEMTIKSLRPKLSNIEKLKARGLMATAMGTETDFVSRFFAPQSGIDEDPVTGSAHTTLTPLWSKKLNKLNLTARQLSSREGNINCRLNNDRVELTGTCYPYLIGEITVT